MVTIVKKNIIFNNKTLKKKIEWEPETEYTHEYLPKESKGYNTINMIRLQNQKVNTSLGVERKNIILNFI